jgi:hypothetical protein
MEADASFDTFLSENERHKHGRVIYDLSKDFGVNIPELRKRFQFYYDRFPVQKEEVLGE